MSQHREQEDGGRLSTEARTFKASVMTKPRSWSLPSYDLPQLSLIFKYLVRITTSDFLVTLALFMTSCARLVFIRRNAEQSVIVSRKLCLWRFLRTFLLFFFSPPLILVVLNKLVMR